MVVLICFVYTSFFLCIFISALFGRIEAISSYVVLVDVVVFVVALMSSVDFVYVCMGETRRIQAYGRVSCTYSVPALKTFLFGDVIALARFVAMLVVKPPLFVFSGCVQVCSLDSRLRHRNGFFVRFSSGYICFACIQSSALGREALAVPLRFIL